MYSVLKLGFLVSHFYMVILVVLCIMAYADVKWTFFSKTKKHILQRNEWVWNEKKKCLIIIRVL